jgi:hypothetical protein
MYISFCNQAFQSGKLYLHFILNSVKIFSIRLDYRHENCVENRIRIARILTTVLLRLLYLDGENCIYSIG